MADHRLAALLADAEWQEAARDENCSSCHGTLTEIHGSTAGTIGIGGQTVTGRLCALCWPRIVTALLRALDRGTPETPEAVREQALIAIGRFLPPILQREAANIIDAIAPILRSADQQEIARLTEVNADLLSKIGPASYGFKDGIYNICLGYHDEEGVWEWLEVVDRAENARLSAALATAREHIEEINGIYDANCARLTARLAEVEGAVREWQAARTAWNDAFDASPGLAWVTRNALLSRLNSAEAEVAALSLEAPRE